MAEKSSKAADPEPIHYTFLKHWLLLVNRKQMVSGKEMTTGGHFIPNRHKRFERGLNRKIHSESCK
ncbi:MAG: hypothetical protein ACE5HI_19150 [bacterium]